MAEKIRIFICYRRQDSSGKATNHAYKLFGYLSKMPDYDVWMDEKLDAGFAWEKTIYEKLISCHVVVLAISDGTSDSLWVNREVSIAMAFGVPIIPIGLNIDEANLRAELVKLRLGDLQHKTPFNMSSHTASAITTELEQPIQRAHERSKTGGYELIKRIAANVTLPVKPAKSALSAARKEISLPSGPITIHVASGDIFRLNGYDILVNSENDFMHMARIFDMASMSSNIRHLGSSTERGYIEDTIQIEIERAVSGSPRPVPPGTTFVTSSGGPTSKLYKINRVSHVVHVAAVQGVIAEHRIVPLRSDGQIRDCVTSALLAVQDLCRARGVVSPEGTSQRSLQLESAANFSPKGVVLPLFGTGRGGQTPAVVGPLLLGAIVDFFNGPLRDREHMPITDVYVSAFSDDDVAAVTHLLSELESA